MKSFFIFSAMLFVSTFSIGCSQAPAQALEELAAARVKWLENCDTKNYVAKFEKVDLGWGSHKSEIVTKVKNSQMAEGFIDFNKMFSDHFEALQPQNDTVKTEIKYHSKYGYPTFFSYDSTVIYDEEFELRTLEVSGCGA